MTETTDAEPTAGEQTADPDRTGSGASADRNRQSGSANGWATLDGGRSLREKVQLGLLGILLLVVAIATLQLYFSAGAAVDRFVTSQYRPLFQAGFNLAVLLAAGAGLSVLLRRLS